jgi:hypothetical protein
MSISKTYFEETVIVESGKSFLRGSLSTDDLLLQISLDQLLFILNNTINRFTEQATLMGRSTVLRFPLS